MAKSPMVRPRYASFAAALARRLAVFVLLASSASCRSGSVSTPAAASSENTLSLEPEPAGLEVALVTQMQANERGGVVVVLLHGYGARGDDLVSLARSLSRPRTRFIVPVAPLRLPDGGRAWWQIDAADRPRYVTDNAAPMPTRNAQLEVARRAVQAVLTRAVQQYAPEQLFLAGFSQGAMLALDVALSDAPAVQRVAVLSGALLLDAAALLEAQRARRPAVFISHGQEDPRLPFSGAERMKSALEAHGFSVVWQPFHGGHEIPSEVRSELESFLFR